MKRSKDRAILSPNEARERMGVPPIGSPQMQQQPEANKFFVLEPRLFETIVGYLANRPWHEVDNILEAIKTVRQVTMTLPPNNPPPVLPESPKSESKPPPEAKPDANSKANGTAERRGV